MVVIFVADGSINRSLVNSYGTLLYSVYMNTWLEE